MGRESLRSVAVGSPRSNRWFAGSDLQAGGGPMWIGSAQLGPNPARTSWESIALSTRCGSGECSGRRTRSISSRIERPLVSPLLGTPLQREFGQPHRGSRRTLGESVPSQVRRGSTTRHVGDPTAPWSRGHFEPLHMVEARSSPSHAPRPVLPGLQPPAPPSSIYRSPAIR